jgi:carbamoyltransferase
VMGLAPYGEPRYAGLIYDHLLDLREDGSFHLNMEYFNYCQGLTMTSERFHRLFGGPPRAPESEVTQRDMDLARSLQDVTEEVMLRMARHVRKETGERNLCLAGGVALNCVGNGRILRERVFDRLWIQPAAGDAGGALGPRSSPGTRSAASPGASTRAATASRARTWGPRFPAMRSGNGSTAPPSRTAGTPPPRSRASRPS